MPDSSTAERICAIFLHDDQPVTPEVAARLLGWSLDDMDALIKWREVDVNATPAGPRIARAELVAHALRQWPLSVIQGTIGSPSIAASRAEVDPRFRLWFRKMMKTHIRSIEKQDWQVTYRYSELPPSDYDIMHDVMS